MGRRWGDRAVDRICLRSEIASVPERGDRGHELGGTAGEKRVTAHFGGFVGKSVLFLYQRKVRSDGEGV